MKQIDNYYTEKQYTFILAHGLENIIDRLLANDPSLRVVRGENGSELIVISKIEG